MDIMSNQPKEDDMQKASRESAPHVESGMGYEGRFAEIGPYTVVFESYSEDMDLAPLFRGLPDDRCQCPHWGVVLEGRVGFRFGDGEQVAEAGEAYYAAPGHTPVMYAGARIVEFSPTDELRRTLEVVKGNVEAMTAGAS
jgi:hypothetical protein